MQKLGRLKEHKAQRHLLQCLGPTGKLSFLQTCAHDRSRPKLRHQRALHVRHKLAHSQENNFQLLKTLVSYGHVVWYSRRRKQWIYVELRSVWNSTTNNIINARFIKNSTLGYARYACISRPYLKTLNVNTAQKEMEENSRQKFL